MGRSECGADVLHPVPTKSCPESAGEHAQAHVSRAETSDGPMKIRGMWGRSDLWRGSRTERRGRSEDGRDGPRRGGEALMSLDWNGEDSPEIHRHVVRRE